jgi:16S rRNA G966 N2-methylase RsmD
MVKNLIRYYRYAWYLFRSYVLEKSRGLDFHYQGYKYKNSTSHGYNISPESHLRTIFNYLNSNKMIAGNNFIDVGCGKGYVLIKASKQAYHKVSGIDIEPELIRIAQKNLSVLKLQNRLNVLCVNALEFEHYDEYEHFFFFNPFTAEVLKPVIHSILNSLEKRPREILIIYFHPTAHNILMETERFELVEKLKCFIKQGYETYIYRNI